MKLHHAIIIYMLCFIIFFSCKSQHDESTSLITFTTGDVTVNGIPASAGKILNSNDIIKTADNSYTTVQFGSKIIITIKSNTEILINEMNVSAGKEKCSIDIRYGNIFNKISGGVNQYNVRTPTLVAAVRGTSFTVSCEKKTGSSSVQLLKGKLNVTKTKESDKLISGLKDESIYLTEGEKIYMTGDMAVSKSSMNAEEIEELKKYDTILPVTINEKMIKAEKKDQVTEKKSIEPSALSELQKDQIIRAIPEIRSSGGSENKDQSYQEKLNEIKIQNRGQLDVLNLKDGGSIKGMLLQRGMVYRIKTPNGIKEILAEDVASQTIIK